MDFKDLNFTERTALVALIRSGVLADGQLSGNEESAFGLLVHLLGEESYAALAANATERVKDDAALRELLIEVENQEARELIYGTLMQVLSSETVSDREGRLLDLVGEIWDIRPRFEGFPEETA